MMTRKRFPPTSFALTLLLAGSAPVCAAPPTPLPKAASQVEAAHLLMQGRQYERARELLQAALAAQPDDYENDVLLGCAFVCRAAALAHADVMTAQRQQEQVSYPHRLRQWEAAQKDADGEREPRPTPPSRLALRTRDDKLPYLLTRPQLNARLSDLIERAQAAWDKAARLAKTDEEKARVEFMRGWGMRLLQKSGSAFDEDADPPPDDPILVLKNLPKTRTIVAAFAKAVALVPDNAVYWQALGDAEDDTERQARAWEKSLALNPKNSALWAELYRCTLDETYEPAPDALRKPIEPRAKLEKGVSYLNQAAKYDPSNAWYLYEEAALRFQRELFGFYLHTRPALGDDSNARITPEQAQKAVQAQTSRQAGQAALARIEAGNQRSRYRQPQYTPPVPRVLAAAWGYFPDTSDGDLLSHLGTLSDDVRGYSLAAVSEAKQVGEGLRAAQALLQMGLKLCGGMRLDDKKGDPPAEETFVGYYIAEEALSHLVTVYELTGDREAKARAQAELAVCRARSKAYQAHRIPSADDTAP